MICIVEIYNTTDPKDGKFDCSCEAEELRKLYEKKVHFRASWWNKGQQFCHSSGGHWIDFSEKPFSE